MVVIDTDVLVLAFAFHHDARQGDNARFLAVVREPAITVYNLMEFLGQISFNLAPDRLARWPIWLQKAYGLTIIWPSTLDQDAMAFFHDEIHVRPLARMQTYRMAFLDSLIVSLAERTPNVDTLVTWNARHFRDKTALAVLTPTEFLQDQS